MIDIPDAASIGKALRGRGYTRFERSAVAQFQGAWVGAPAAGTATRAAALRATDRPFETLGLAPVDVTARSGPGHPAGDSGPTELSELVKAVIATGRQAPPRRAWLDPLPPLIPLAALPAVGPRDGGLLAPIGYGMADLPGQQRQEPLVFDLERGSNLLIGGAAQSGRTTALRTIAARIAASYSPADVHLYALDCDAGALAPLARLPHCGAVVRGTEAERAGRLLDRLDAEVARRRDLLSADGFASVTEQRRRVPAASRQPYLVLLLDRWEAFSEDLGQLDNQRLTATLNRLLAQGASAGLRVIVTGGLAALNKLAGNCPERIVLRLSGPNDLYSAGVPRGAMPDRPAEGRGLLLPATTEVQIAFIGADPSGTAQTTAMNELIGAAAVRVPRPDARAAAGGRAAVPDHARASQRAARLDGARAAAARAGRRRGRTLRARPRPGPVPRIRGRPPQSGKSTALVVLAESLLAGGPR